MDAVLLSHASVYFGPINRHEWLSGDAISGLNSETHRLWYVRSGALRVRLGGTLYELRPEHVLVLPAHVRRDISPRDGDGAVWDSALFSATVFGGLDLLALLPLPLLIDLQTSADGALLHAALQTLAAESEGAPWRPGGRFNLSDYAASGLNIPQPSLKPGVASGPLRQGLARTLLALFWRHAERIPDRSRGSASPGITGNTPEMFPHWLVEVIALITQDPARHLPDLAFHAGVSPTQLRRAFRRHLGVTPVEYLNRARLERARSLIETTDGTVSEIATRVGLDSLSYFTKRYKEAFGHTPGRHRTRGI